MSYLTQDEVKDAIRPTGFSRKDYFEKNPKPRFDELLEQLEKDSRAVIDNQLKGEGLEYEEDKTEIIRTPHKSKIQLSFPVQDVHKVERRVKDGWRELDETRYRFDKQYLVLRGRSRNLGRTSQVRHRSRNPLKNNTNSFEWVDVSDQVRVVYDRGFETIPQDVKEVQKKIIRKMLTHLRQDQNLAQVDPDDVSNIANERTILTEDIQDTLGGISQAREKYTML